MGSPAKHTPPLRHDHQGALMARKSRQHQFDRKTFERKVERDEREWSAIYQLLRNSCRQSFGHSSSNEIYAKLIIIGRGYSTGIERSGLRLRELAKHMARDGVRIDAWLGELPSDKVLGPKSVKPVLDVHGRFVALLRRYARRRTDGKRQANISSHRSFASKYLHFHRPIVPIFDRIAAQELRSLKLKACALPPEHSEKYHDARYRAFVLRFLALTKAAKRSGCYASVARLDRYLWTPTA
jgi:hypothetical protein